MPYTLVLKDRQIKFYIRDLAEMYQRIYGGHLLYNDRPQLRLVDKQAA